MGDISSQLLRSAPLGNDGSLAALLVAVSLIQQSPRLDPLPRNVLERVKPEIEALPPQHAAKFAVHPATNWLRLVSLADSLGAFDIARVLLDEIERLLDAALVETKRTGRTIGGDPHATQNLRAIVLARRGRLSRQSGDVESAAAWYQSGLLCTRGLPTDEGWATCTLGLATCAQAAGNFPETIRLCRAVLRKGSAIATHSLFGAHLTLAVCYRRQRKLNLALRHAWKAFDLADEPDDRRWQCLVNVAEIALQLGYAAAARSGFLALLSHPQPERNRVPAHVGLLSCELLLWENSSRLDDSVVRARIEAVFLDARTCLQPYERIKALLAALEAAVSIEWTAQVLRLDSLVQRELSEAARNGSRFHEFQFRHDELRACLSVLPTATAAPSATQSRRHSESGNLHTKQIVSRLTSLMPLGADDSE